MDYFKRLQELLKLEREEDRLSYLKLTESSSVSVRRTAGLTWYPVAIKGSEMGRGDYLIVEVERTTHIDLPHQLRFGASAVLFSHHNPAQDRTEGVISFISGNRLKLTLNTDELPEWSRDGKLGIDLLFDDSSYDEMQNALKQASVLREKKEEGRLIRILTGENAPAFQSPDVLSGTAQSEADELSGTGRPDGTQPTARGILNSFQQAAVTKILSAGELAIVHGPPGTGKTTTLVQAIKALIKQDGKQILVVAPSNTAVDLLSEKLADEGLNTLRIGNPARVSQRLMALTLDSKMGEHPAMKEIRKLKKQANEFRDMAHKYKRNFGKAERDQRKALFDEARNILKSVDTTEQYIIDDLLTRAQVITATLVGASHYTVRKLKFHTVVIDEAGQALEPACWIPILKGQKLVLAGDHCQLPPTVKSPEADKKGLSTTLLEKAVALHPQAVVLLEEQYRMHETIMGYSSAVFYQDRLIAHSSVARHVLFPEDGPLLFVDTAGCGFEEKAEGTGISNPEEAAFLFKHLSRLVDEVKTKASQNHLKGNGLNGNDPKEPEFPSIAVISPYRHQIQVLKDQLLNRPDLLAYGDKLSVNTIDSFQGQERDIVYISMTRSNSDNKIGFLADIRRMNVAMTRARKKLVVIGDSATLSQHSFYGNLISYAERHNAWQSAWELAE